MCMVAPRGSTISLTSLEIPLSSATSMLVGMVATEEQVPREVMVQINYTSFRHTNQVRLFRNFYTIFTQFFINVPTYFQ